MKRMYLIFSIFFLIIPVMFSLAQGEAAEQENNKELVIYCYDSFASEWGAGPSIVKAFTEKTGITVRLEAPGDAVTLLTQLILEKESPKADVVIGLDNNLLERTLEADILIPYESPMLKGIRSELILDDSHHLIPFDYGFFALCYDSESLKEIPASLEDLTDPRLKDSIILMDPRTSTPGMGFLLWTMKVYGENWKDYWERLEPNILTITESWSTGYGLFTNGEAPIVLSYSSSPAYHVEYEDSTRYQAMIFEEGHPVQIEGAGIVKGTKNEAEGQLFIDFLLNEESQQTLALSNVMFPVKEETPLPPSFDFALKTDNILNLQESDLSEDSSNAVQEWLEILSD